MSPIVIRGLLCTLEIVLRGTSRSGPTPWGLGEGREKRGGEEGREGRREREKGR